MELAEMLAMDSRRHSDPICTGVISTKFCPGNRVFVKLANFGNAKITKNWFRRDGVWSQRDFYKQNEYNQKLRKTDFDGTPSGANGTSTTKVNMLIVISILETPDRNVSAIFHFWPVPAIARFLGKWPHI
eukprot:PDM70929.1 hypothetical protein PRIPAC_44325 [Pristionchus pacificus]